MERNELNLEFPDINAEGKNLTEDVISKEDAKKRFPLIQKIVDSIPALKEEYCDKLYFDEKYLYDKYNDNFEFVENNDGTETWTIYAVCQDVLMVPAAWHRHWVGEDEYYDSDVDIDAHEELREAEEHCKELAKSLPIKTDCFSIDSLEFIDIIDMITDELDADDEDEGWMLGYARRIPDPDQDYAGIWVRITATVKKECINEDLVFGEPVHRSADREVGIMSDYYDAEDSEVDIYSDFSNKNINNEDAFYDSDSDRYGTYEDWAEELKVKEFKHGTPEYEIALKRFADDCATEYDEMLDLANKSPDKADLIEAKVLDERRPRTEIIPKNPEVFEMEKRDIADGLWLEYVNDRFIDKRREEFENNYSPW